VIDLSTDKNLIGPWVFKKIGKVWHPEGREAVGLVRDDEVLAGCIVEDYTGNSCQMHIALAHAHVPLRKFIVAGFHYVFVDLGCEQVLGFVSSANKKALMFDMKLGFEPIAVIPKVYNDNDLIIMRMLRSQCRWIAAEARRKAA